MHSFNEATRIYELQKKSEEEYRKRCQRQPTIEEIVQTKFGGDYELWSDHITWVEDCDDKEIIAPSSKKGKVTSGRKTMDGDLQQANGSSPHVAASDFMCSLSPLAHQ